MNQSSLFYMQETALQDCFFLCSR